MDEGVTPALPRVDPGRYDIEVWDGRYRSRVACDLTEGREVNLSTLSLQLATDVPVANALNRNQQFVESVIRASARLKDQHTSGSGLVLLGIPFDPWITVETSKPMKVQLLADTYEPLRDHSDIFFDSNSTSWSAGFPQGGYIIRVFDADPDYGAIDMPIWLASGYQTVVFLPFADRPHLHRASIHMLPITWVWTGYDFPTKLTEVALSNLRRGNRPFGAGSTIFDFGYLSSISPLLGLLRLYDVASTGDQISSDFVGLAQALRDVIPDHPDLSALLLDRQLYFPPLYSMGYSTITETPRGATRVLDNSLLASTFEHRVRLGIHSTWVAARIERTSFPPNTTSKSRELPFATVAANVSHILWHALAMSVAVIFGLVLIFRLLRMSEGDLVGHLGCSGNEASEQRIGAYLSDLVAAGESGEAIKALMGAFPSKLASATNLPVQTVDKALPLIRRNVQSSIRAERKRRKHPPGGST